MHRLRITRNILLGIKSLMLHKLRSLLTMLGVVFGVASVIAMLAVGEGASAQAQDQIRKLGVQNILISSVKPVEDVAAGTRRTSMSIYGLLYEDERRIAESFRSVRRIVPVKLVRAEGRLGHRAMELRVVGTTPDWFDLVEREMIAGGPLLEYHMTGPGNPVVLTESGARRLLATEHTLGQSVRIGSDYFEVVGIVRSEEGVDGLQTPDQAIDAYIPLRLAQERFGDITTRRSTGSFERERVELHQIIVEVESVDRVQPVAQAIEAMLARFHPKRDYRIDVPLALLRQAEATKRTFNIVLGSIASISLLVGGIGIMNIMLASVTERTREIGIRRAIGAKKRQIVGQFITEAVVLSTVGGLIGLGLGMLIPWVITLIAQMPTAITPYSLALAVGISMAVGVIFGGYPAYRAANLDPIVALRHE